MEPVKQEDLWGNVVEKDVLLRDKFLEPPFSVLDTKGGAWQARKRLWKAMGIESHLGREGVVVINNSFDGEKYGRAGMPEVSIFDPALCELMYRWYCPKGGTILDPFAGGSVRGIVANYLGFRYTGVDIRPEQIASNMEQGLKLLKADNQPDWHIGDSNVVLKDFICGNVIAHRGTGEHTPIEKHGENWVKRDDLFNVCGANGSKARAAYYLITTAKEKGFTIITTAGSRKSPQINIVAQICEKLALKFIAHCPEGQLSDELLDAKKHGAEIIQHKAGYNSVIIARAKEYAVSFGAFEVPFGMMCDEAIEQAANQVYGLPAGIKRIVIPVGSGMNLAGLLTGLQKAQINIPVVGVIVGADPVKTLDSFAPMGWRNMCTLVESTLDYHDEVVENKFHDIVLDPVYEAKCLQFIEPGDLLWIVGVRRTLLPADAPQYSYVPAEMLEQVTQPVKNFDMVFSCPPYADLEVYSDLPGDISNKDYKDFMAIYTEIIQKSVALLKTGGYAVFVVGDMRDKKGFYRDFVSDTKRAFIAAGAGLYNDAVLLQPLGTAMLRAAKIFEAGGKLTKVHENVLIFKKQ